MSQDEYDQAFEELLEQEEYDNAQDALYQLVRISFKAGWDAAGGEPRNPQDKFQLMRRNPGNEPQK